MPTSDENTDEQNQSEADRRSDYANKQDAADYGKDE